MMKKKILMITTVLTLSLLAGCGNQQTDDVTGAPPTTSEQADTSATSTTGESASTAADTSAPTTEATPTPTEEVTPHTHNYTEAITTEASCEADGVKTFTCECGDSYTEAIPATGHTYENYVYNEDATHTADGTETATCVCGLPDTRTASGTKLEYTYTDLDQTMYAKQTVNVRDLPSTDGNKLGGLDLAEEVHITGQCNETNWYRIEFDGTTAYVSNSYLVAEKPDTSAQATANNTQPAASGTLESCPYELLKLYDNGGKEITYYYIYNGSYDYVQPLNEATEILYQRGYTKTYTDENGTVWTTSCVAWDYETHEYAEGTVTQCNVFYGEFLNSITGLPEFHGEGYMVATRY